LRITKFSSPMQPPRCAATSPYFRNLVACRIRALPAQMTARIYMYHQNKWMSKHFVCGAITSGMLRRRDNHSSKNVRGRPQPRSSVEPRLPVYGVNIMQVKFGSCQHQNITQINLIDIKPLQHGPKTPGIKTPTPPPPTSFMVWGIFLRVLTCHPLPRPTTYTNEANTIEISCTPTQQCYQFSHRAAL